MLNKTKDNKAIILPNLSETESIIVFDFLMMRQRNQNIESRSSIIMIRNSIVRDIALEIQRGRIPDDDDYNFKKYFLKRMPLRYWIESLPVRDDLIDSYIKGVINYLMEKTQLPENMRKRLFDEVLFNEHGIS